MSEHRDVIKLPQGDIEYTIKDVANLFLKSGTLTGILIKVITTVARDVVIQGVKEIVLIIEDIRDEVVLTIYEGKIRRRQAQIARLMQMYDAEITRVENLPLGAPGTRFQQLWLEKLAEAFYCDLARVL